MPLNKNEKPKDENNVPETVVPNAQKQSEGNTPTPKSNLLNNALVRTFRGDLTKQGSKGTRVAEKLIPQNKPVTNASVTGSQPVSKAKTNRAVVHTFKDDVQNLVRNRKTSLTRIAAMESNRRSKESDAPEVETSNKKVIVIGLIILFVIILGVFGLGSYYAYQLNTSTESIPQVEPSFIFTEARERVDITDKNARSIVELLASVRRNTFFSLGSMIELYVTETIQINESTENTEHIGSQGFLQSINASVPATFIQTLGTDYVLGIHVIDENVPFIVLTTQSYGHAFAGMLQWENNMEEDLLPFFSPNAEFIKPAVAESSNSFKDEVIENLDVRILRDTDDEIRVVYAFVDRKTVLITTDIRTLTELANRARIQ